MSVPGPEQKHAFEEGHRSGIAAIGDRLRAQRPGKTRLQWREVHRHEGGCPCGISPPVTTGPLDAVLLLHAQGDGHATCECTSLLRHTGDEAATVERWLVVGCHGAGRSVEAAADRRLVASGAVPAAGVAVQLGVSGKLQVHTVSGPHGAAI